jgi:hypothetical protein
VSLRTKLPEIYTPPLIGSTSGAAETSRPAVVRPGRHPSLTVLSLVSGAIPSHRPRIPPPHCRETGRRRRVLAKPACTPPEGFNIPMTSHRPAPRRSAARLALLLGNAVVASAVTSFQRGKGLDADGIVGPNTWSALITTVRNGSNGPAVKALQSLLNAKRGATTLTAAARDPFRAAAPLSRLRATEGAP